MIDKTEVKNTTGLVWFGNDLRIHDNDVLSYAVKNHTKVIGVYIIDPFLFEENMLFFKKMDVFRAQFLLESLHDLKHQLLTKNISLLVFLDKPEIKLKAICDSYQIDSIYKQKEWTHEENISKIKVQKSLQNTIKIIEVYNQFLYHPEDVNIKIENIPQVFSNLRKKLEKYVAVRANTEVQKLNSANIINTTNHIPTLNELGFKLFEKDKRTAFPFHGGESEGLKRLHNYFFETKKIRIL